MASVIGPEVRKLRPGSRLVGSPAVGNFPILHHIHGAHVIHKYNEMTKVYDLI